MEHMNIKQSAIIDAPVEAVYAVIADYEVGHNAILPKPFFKSMEVLKGGYGEGTEIYLKTGAFGVEKDYHQRVTEPAPGRILVERDIHTNLGTTFYFEPLNGNSQTRITIDSEIGLSGGWQSVMERLFNPMIIGQIFKQELKNLADYVAHNLRVRAQ